MSTSSHHFVDRARGIGMVVSSQHLPFWDEDIKALRECVMRECERSDSWSPSSIEQVIYGTA